MKPWVEISITATCLSMLWVVPGSAQPVTTRVVAVSDTYHAELMGTIDDVTIPALNDLGQVAFNAAVFPSQASPSTEAKPWVLRGGSSGLTAIAGAGTQSPDGIGFFDSFADPSINRRGSVAFLAFLDQTTGNDFSDQGVYLGDGASIVQLVRGGRTPADGNELLHDFQSVNLNGNDTVVFANGGVGATTRAVFRSDGDGMSAVVRSGDPAPGGNSTIKWIFQQAALNDAGQSAFVTMSIDNLSGFADGQAIVRHSSSGLEWTARAGQPAPNGGGPFNRFRTPSINESGELAFFAFLGDAFSNDSGIYRADATGEIMELARIGGVAPGEVEPFDSFSAPAINAVGLTMFTASVRDMSRRGGPIGPIIYLGDDDGLWQVVRPGWSVPGGDGTFSTISQAALNDLGQVAFLTSIAGSTAGGDDAGLYAAMPAGNLVELARVGDPFLGSTITKLDFRAGFGSHAIDFRVSDSEENGFNNMGEVAYRFELEDGRSGIAVARIVPEPTSVALLLIAVTLTCVVHSRIDHSKPSAGMRGEASDSIPPRIGLH